MMNDEAQTMVSKRLDAKSIRIAVVFLLLVGALLALAGRCLQLQYYRGARYVSLALNQQQASVPEKPCRGGVLDRCGRVLAASNRIQIIFAEPGTIKDPKETASLLASAIDIPAHEICKTITESRNPGYAKIKVTVEPGQSDIVRKVGIKGIGIQSGWQRYYPMGRLVSHVVGFTSGDDRGLAGIELVCDKELRGSAGQNVFFADAFRRPVRLKTGKGHCADGTSVILTIDAAIQQFARTELLTQYEAYEAESAAAIVMDVSTGAVLAMVCLPDFDPQNAASDPSTLRNRLLTDPYEPGSVLKPIAAAIALDAGVIDLDEKIFCEDGHYSGRGFGRIGEYGNHRFGELTLREILVKSSNIGMAKVGQKLGKNRLFEGLKLFGFGRKTGVGLPGEGSGLLRPVSKWTGYSETRIPFGQEISVTTIQLAQAFCILANGGRSVQPHVIKATVDSQGNFVRQNSSAAAAGFIIKPEIARWIVQEALTGVVNEGTGKKAALEKWQVFGKTGTANIARTDGPGYSEDDYVATFVAGAPADTPAVIVLVSIRKPNKALGKGYTGGTVAAPVVGAILDKTLTYLEQAAY